MSQIPFSPEVDIEVIGVETVQVSLIEVDSSMGTSMLQAYQDFLSLDGGRPLDVFSGITPLDGGRA